MSMPCWLPGISIFRVTCLPSKNWLRLLLACALAQMLLIRSTARIVGFIQGTVLYEFSLGRKKLQREIGWRAGNERDGSYFFRSQSKREEPVPERPTWLAAPDSEGRSFGRQSCRRKCLSQRCCWRRQSTLRQPPLSPPSRYRLLASFP